MNGTLSAFLSEGYLC